MDKKTQDDNIKNLDLNAKINRFLLLDNITKISHLTDKSEGDLLNTKNLGKVFVQQIKTALNQRGLKLRGQQ